MLLGSCFQGSVVAFARITSRFAAVRVSVTSRSLPSALRTPSLTGLASSRPTKPGGQPNVSDALGGRYRGDGAVIVVTRRASASTLVRLPMLREAANERRIIAG